LHFDLLSLLLMKAMFLLLGFIIFVYNFDLMIFCVHKVALKVFSKMMYDLYNLNFKLCSNQCWVGIKEGLKIGQGFKLGFRLNIS